MVKCVCVRTSKLTSVQILSFHLITVVAAAAAAAPQTINIVLCYAIYKVSKQSRANVKILSFWCVSVNCCVLFAVKCNLVLCQSN